jgi:hypothetical protein
MSEPLPDTKYENPRVSLLNAVWPAARTPAGGYGDEMAGMKSSVGLGTLPSADVMRVERQCSRFEAAWKAIMRLGKRPVREPDAQGDRRPLSDALTARDRRSARPSECLPCPKSTSIPSSAER